MTRVRRCGPVPRRRRYRERIDRAGAGELTTFPVGQIVGTMNQVKPVSRVIYAMVEEYIETMERLGTLTEG